MYISHIPKVCGNYNTNDKNISPKSYQTAIDKQI